MSTREVFLILAGFMPAAGANLLAWGFLLFNENNSRGYAMYTICLGIVLGLVMLMIASFISVYVGFMSLS